MISERCRAPAVGLFLMTTMAFAADALIWTPGNKGNGAAVSAALSANGRSSQIASDIRSLSLGSFTYVFVCLGVSPNTYTLSESANSTEIAKLIAYLNAGGKVYMEGGDTWARDFPTSLHTMFKIRGEADGANDLTTVVGTGCLEGLAFAYGGNKAYIDRITPLDGAGLFFVNAQPAYGCGVAYDSGVYRTVGVSFEFGGLTEGASTKAALMGQLLNFFDSGCALGKPAPVALEASSGYDGAVPLLWQAPPGQFSLAEEGAQEPSLLYIASRKPLPLERAVTEQSASVYQTLSYNIYRATSAAGSFTKIASGVRRQYYRDTSVSNGVTYYYAVTSVYSSGESGLSAKVAAAPQEGGRVIRSPWTRTLPQLDGRIDAGEWAWARVTDIRTDGESEPVRLYVMNRLDYLYLAIDEPADLLLDLDDQVGLYIDQNRNGEWSYEPPLEGTFWAAWNGSSVSRLYRALSGWWPTTLEWREPSGSSRLQAAASTTAGRVQYELRLDLSDLGLTPPNVFPLRCFLYAFDSQAGDFRGMWPQDVLNTSHRNGWAAPVLYGTLELAVEEGCEPWSETQAMSVPGSYVFHLPGDGHAVTVNVRSLSGSGPLTVVQTNCPYPNLPGADALPLWWRIEIGEGIADLTADVGFSYTDDDAAGFQENEAFWGAAWYNPGAEMWVWKGGTVDAANNRVTVTDVSQGGVYVLFRRLFGDYTGDGYVDLDDFQAFGDVWQQQAADEFPQGSAAAFFNCGKRTQGGIQIIDLDDFQVFGDMWNRGIKP